MSNSRTFKKHKKTNHIYNPESGLVLKSGDEKTIIGRIDGDAFIEFDETCLKLCKEFSFKYDEKLLDKIPKEQVEAVEEDEEDAEDAEEEEEEESEETEKVEKKLDFSSIPVNQNQERKLSTVAVVPVQERKASLVEKVSSKTDKCVSSQDTKLKISEFLDKKTEDMKKFLFEIDTENKNKISELEETLKKLNKDYEDVKKKLKAVLSAMNESL